MHTASIALPIRTPQDRKALLSHCQTYDERTRLPGRHGGTIGATALRVLEALMFKLADPVTGACIASCREIQRVTRLRRTAVKKATAILDGVGLAVKRFRAGTGPFPNDANAYEFADPRAVFRHFFGEGGGRGAAPNYSPSKILLESSRPTTRREPEVVLAEIEAPAEPPGVMTGAAWAAAIQPALEAAAAPSGAGDEQSQQPESEGDGYEYDEPGAAMSALQDRMDAEIRQIARDNLESFEEVVEAVREQACERIGAGPMTAERLAEIVGSAQATIDADVAGMAANAERLHGKRIGCKAGCSHCCYQHIYPSTVEIAALVARLRPEDRPALLDRALPAAERIGAITTEERYRKAVGCVFLEGADCGIYAARPIVCRTYLSLSRRACHVDWHDRLRKTERRGVPLLGEPQMYGGTFATGVDLAMHCAGLEVEHVELTRGVAVLLAPGALDRWLAGERLFGPWRHVNPTYGEMLEGMREAKGL
tara:strand:+ start:11565 stop:13010 length:1446 start_codon:yes stop_codon:yes gene_type:complete